MFYFLAGVQVSLYFWGQYLKSTNGLRFTNSSLCVPCVRYLVHLRFLSKNGPLDSPKGSTNWGADNGALPIILVTYYII